MNMTLRHVLLLAAIGSATAFGFGGSCTSTPGWRDQWGSCATYTSRKWCTTHGKPGPGWQQRWGALDAKATANCCGCGKKARSTGAPAKPTAVVKKCTSKAKTKYTALVGACKWSQYLKSKWAYQSKGNSNVRGCMTACNKSPKCTGFEIKRNLTNTKHSYCAFWFGGSCDGPGAKGWGTVARKHPGTTYTTYTSCAAPKYKPAVKTSGVKGAPAEFAFSLTNVGTSLIEVSGEPAVAATCFALVDLSVKSLIDQGLTQYAWLSGSKIPAAKRTNAKSGAFVYKGTKNGVAVKQYKKISVVPVNTSRALKFGFAKPFMSSYKTFASLKAANFKAGTPGAIAKADIVCSEAAVSLGEAPWNAYTYFAWVRHEAVPGIVTCGAFVYEKKNGGGLVSHSCGTTLDDSS